MFHKMKVEDWKAVIDVHLHGAFNVCRATIELFREQQDGAYALFTSTSGVIGNIGQANYGAAKLGVHGLSHIRSEEHTSELQSLMRLSYAVFCLKKKQHTKSYQPTVTVRQPHAPNPKHGDLLMRGYD